MDAFKTFLLDLLFPRRCVGCSVWGTLLCGQCRATLKAPARICPLCEYSSIDGMTHPGCRRPMGMDGLIAAVTYQRIARALVHAMKYRWVTILAPIVAFEIGRVLRLHPRWHQWATEQPMLIPIPLHAKRERSRGFNQSTVMAYELGRHLRLPVITNILIRVKPTLPQVARDGKERRTAMRGAFRVLDPGRCSGKTVFLLDDVWTTGTTMREAASTLKRSGASAVFGLVFARSEGRLV